MEVVDTKKSVIIKLYWDDFTEEAQNKIREVLHYDADDNGNWDVIPMTIMEVDKSVFYEITDEEIESWEKSQRKKIS